MTQGKYKYLFTFIARKIEIERDCLQRSIATGQRPNKTEMEKDKNANFS